MSDLSNKDYNVATINMFIQLRETLTKEVKEGKIKSHQRAQLEEHLTLDLMGHEFEPDTGCRDYLLSK